MPGLDGQSHAQQFCRDPLEMPTRKAAERQQGVGCGTGNTGDLRQEEIWGGLGRWGGIDPPAAVSRLSSTHFIIVMYGWGPRANCSSKWLLLCCGCSLPAVLKPDAQVIK